MGEEWAGYATYALGYLNYWAGEDLNAVPQLERAITLLADVDSAYVARAQIFLAGLLDDLDRGRRVGGAGAPGDRVGVAATGSTCG